MLQINFSLLIDWTNPLRIHNSWSEVLFKWKNMPGPILGSKDQEAAQMKTLQCLNFWKADKHWELWTQLP
jgi:hypothetical protein